MADTKEYRRLSDGAVIALTDAQFNSVNDLFSSTSAPVGAGSPLQQQRDLAAAARVREETLRYIEGILAAEKKAKDAKAATEAEAAKAAEKRAANERDAAAVKKLAADDRAAKRAAKHES